MIEKILLSTALACMPAAYMIDVHAEDDSTLNLQDQISDVTARYDLDNSSFSAVYYDTVTGETFDWNGQTYMFAASTYKLALNMYYYLQENAGLIDKDAYVGGYDLAYAHYLSIVQSDNDASEAMIYGLGSYADYQNDMFSTFGDPYYQDLSNIEEIAFYDNHYPADFMMDVLKYLYNNQDQFSELLSYMSDPEQRNGFDNTLRENCTVYQKQGWYEYTNAVVEIVDSSEPYLAVIMVDDENHGNGVPVCEEVNQIFYDYNAQQAEVRAQQLAAEEQARAKQQSEEMTDKVEIPDAENEQESDNSRTILYVLFGIMAGSIVICGLVTVIKR